MLTVSPSCHVGMHHEGLATARPTCPSYVDGRLFLKDRITVASTCRRCIHFGCYVISLEFGQQIVENDRLVNYIGFQVPLCTAFVHNKALGNNIDSVTLCMHAGKSSQLFHKVSVVVYMIFW